MHIISRGRRVTVNLCWLHWISNFQQNPVPGQISPEEPLGIVMLSLVFIWDTMHIWTASNTQFWSLFLHWAPFFLTFKCLYRVLKAIMFSSICPIYTAPSWLQSSFHQWVWTHKCWHRDYPPCEEQFNQINLWEVPSASSLQSPTAKGWHNLWLA